LRREEDEMQGIPLKRCSKVPLTVFSCSSVLFLGIFHFLHFQDVLSRELLYNHSFSVLRKKTGLLVTHLQGVVGGGEAESVKSTDEEYDCP
jgi:hypothetical protein